jgi:predicted alpha-1,6-mannanase (GH76 family)
MSQEPAAAEGQAVPRDYRAMAGAAAAALHRWYTPANGQWRTTGWWNAANALTAVIRYLRVTGDASYAGVVETTFRAAGRKRKGFVNTFFDDNGWWALAWLAAYDLTADRRYLETAQAIFAHNLGAWDDTCGGGVWWNEDRTYKNAVTNELFLLLAALLQQRVPGTQQYLDWALREWEWLSGSGMIGPSGLVNDGLNAACTNNHGVTWTYNQGVILGGLTALHEITGEPELLRQARFVADAAVSRLTNPPGILAEPRESSGANGDETQFKGIFARYLGDLAVYCGEPAYRAFLLANADCAWDRNRNRADEFGLRWGGPFDKADASRQSCALELLTAAALVAG